LALTTGLASAQTGPPATDIYLAEIEVQADSIRIVGRPRNITDRAGYDNQPSFTPDGARILYTSYREDGQSDVYVYDIRTGKTSAFTRTPESEYSPRVMPGGTQVSVVRVEADSTQRLWQFPLAGGDPGVLLPQQTGVGYYAWGSDSTVALFILGDPHELHVGNIRTGETTRVTENIGRSLHHIPGANAVSFAQMREGRSWWVMRLDLDTREIRPLVKLGDQSPDCAWTPDGTLLTSSASAISQWKPTARTERQSAVDLSRFSLHGVSRLAVSPAGKYLAIVASR
jgi:Tol biopolymer transport system component